MSCWVKFRARLVAVFLVGLVLTGTGESALDGSASARNFLKGVAAYQNGEYGDAAAAFEVLAASGIRNPRLYYNLGNAYMKTGDLGRAILWYERALKMVPDDPDLNFNYSYALSLVKDEREGQAASIYRILFFWRLMLSPGATAAAAIALNSLFWLTLLVRLARRRKKVLAGMALPLLLAAMFFTATAMYNYYEAAYIQKGVILPETAPVRSGLSEEATELFVLHAGAKVDIQQEKDGFYRIYFSEGKIGWVKQDHVGRI